MAWLEITLDTTPERIGSVVTTLTARGFSDLVIEDQQEFETFLEENRAYWDYIDESLQEKLQGLSHIKLYLEDTDTAGMERLRKAADELNLPPHRGPSGRGGLGGKLEGQLSAPGSGQENRGAALLAG